MTLELPIRYTDAGNLRGRKTRVWGGHQSEFWYCDRCHRRQMEPVIARDRVTRPRCKRCGDLVHPLNEFEMLPTGERKRRCRICRCFLRSGNESGICSPCQNREDITVEPKAQPATTKDMNAIPYQGLEPREHTTPVGNQSGDDPMENYRLATAEDKKAIRDLLQEGKTTDEIRDCLPEVHPTTISNIARNLSKPSEKSEEIKRAGDVLAGIMIARKDDPADGFPWYTLDDVREVSMQFNLPKKLFKNVSKRAGFVAGTRFTDIRTPNNAGAIRQLLLHVKQSLSRNTEISEADLRNHLRLAFKTLGIEYKVPEMLVTLVIERIREYRLLRSVRKNSNGTPPPAPAPDYPPSPARVHFPSIPQRMPDPEFPGNGPEDDLEESIYLDSDAFALFVETVDNGFVVTIRQRNGTRVKKIFQRVEQFLGGNIVSLFQV